MNWRVNNVCDGSHRKTQIKMKPQKQRNETKEPESGRVEKSGNFCLRVEVKFREEKVCLWVVLVESELKMEWRIGRDGIHRSS